MSGLILNMVTLEMTQKQLNQQFRALVQEHGEKIYNLALMKTSNPQAAEDISQETFLRVFKGLPRFRQDASLGTWIYRIALNVCHSHLGKQIPRDALHQDVPDGDLGQIAQTDHDIEESLIQAGDQNLIRKAIAQLPQAQSDAVLLYYYRSYQYAEVADIMNIPLNTVKSHLRRARQKLKVLIPQEVLQ